MTFFVLVCALILDHLFAEPKKYHPLVGFGRLATALEKRFNTPASNHWQLCAGGFAVLLVVLILVVPISLLVWFITHTINNPVITLLVHSLVVYWAIGNQSLKQHLIPIYSNIHHNELVIAKNHLRMTVSRDVDPLNETQVTQAAIETALENGNDAVLGVLFWYCLGGIPAVLAYRLINTLDAMWGYRSARFLYFGRAAARLDDLLNYFPARLVAISYALLANGINKFKLGNFQLNSFQLDSFKRAIHCWRVQAPLLSSPNAGPVMAAGAGSLNVRLGGPAYYQQQQIDKPYFGGDKLPVPADILRAIALVQSTIKLWLVVIAVGSLLLTYCC